VLFSVIVQGGTIARLLEWIAPAAKEHKPTPSV
jgi:hypothetical protein